MIRRAQILVGCGILAAVFHLAGGCTPAVAQQDPPATTGPIITDSAVPVPPGQFQVQPYWSLSFVSGNFSPSWRRVSAGGNFVSLEIPVKFSYGLARNLEVNLVAPFIHNWADQVTNPGLSRSRSASFSGLGDTAFTVKYQLLEEKEWRPTVTAIFNLDFPTGHRSRLNPGRLGTDALGDGTYEFTPGLDLAKWLGPVCLYANLWYSFAARDPAVVPHAQSGPLLVPVFGRDLVTWNMAAEWVLTQRWVALLEFYSIWEVGPLFRRSREATSALMGIMPGLECILSKRWSCALGVVVDLAGKNSPYSCTPIFTTIITF